MGKIVGFFLTSLILTSLSAQEGFTIEHLTTENGMPSNGIKGIQVDDRTGFLWIATEGGLVRFNGTNIRTFESVDSNRFFNRRLLFLVKNLKGDIFSYDDYRWINKVQGNRPIPYDSVGTVFQVFNNLFTLNVSEHLYRQKVTPVKGFMVITGYERILPINDTSCLIIRANQLYFFSTGLKIPELIPLPGITTTQGWVTEGSYFLRDNLGRFFSFDPVTRRCIAIPADGLPDSKTSIFFWDPGMENPILINKKKAWTLKLTDGRLKETLICDTLPDNLLIRHIKYIEKNKTLVIGSEGSGVFLIRKNKMENLRKQPRAINTKESYYAQVALPGGNVFTSNGHEIGPYKTETRLPVTGGFNDFIYRYDSAFWYVKAIATGKGQNQTVLHKYSFTTGATTVFPKVVVNNHLLMKMVGGELFIINNAKIYRLNGDTLALYERLFPPDTGTGVYAIEEIQPGVLASSSCHYVVLYHTITRRIDTLFRTTNACIRSLGKYKNYLFIGTYGEGIYVSRNGITKPLPLDKNKYLLFAHCFMNDADGYCWISTNRGIFKVALEDMINAYENNLPEIYWNYFGKKDGMTMTELNGGCQPCAVELADKTLSFPSMEGLVWVNPALSKPFLDWKSVFIDEIRVDGKRLNPDSFANVQLSHKTGEIQVKLAYPVWENHENVYIRYQLDDDSAWKQVDPSDESLVRLVNLSWGHHILRVRKINGFGKDNFSVIEFPFFIKSPFYATWWFIALVLLSLVGLFFLFLRIRTKQYLLRQQKLEALISEKTKELKEKNTKLEKSDTIKSRLISIINHDIITPLKFLAATGKNLFERRKQMEDQMLDETIYEMTQTSKELQSLATNILNWIKFQNEGRGLLMEKFNLKESIDRSLIVLRPVAHQKDIQVINQVDETLEMNQYFEPLKILLYNIISNAINFSDKGSVTIRSALTEKEIIVSVTDNGVGMTEAQIQGITGHQPYIHTTRSSSGGKGNGLGYLIVRDLLLIVGATMRIKSKIGAGTTVYVVFAR